jgi:hypothetical protein
MRGSWDELRSIGDHLSVGKRSAGQSKTESCAGSAQRGLEMTAAAMGGQMSSLPSRRNRLRDRLKLRGCLWEGLRFCPFPNGSKF